MMVVRVLFLLRGTAGEAEGNTHDGCDDFFGSGRDQEMVESWGKRREETHFLLIGKRGWWL